jgi:hypothetical protein
MAAKEVKLLHYFPFPKPAPGEWVERKKCPRFIKVNLADLNRVIVSLTGVPKICCAKPFMVALIRVLTGHTYNPKAFSGCRGHCNQSIFDHFSQVSEGDTPFIFEEISNSWQRNHVVGTFITLINHLQELFTQFAISLGDTATEHEKEEFESAQRHLRHHWISYMTFHAK